MGTIQPEKISTPIANPTTLILRFAFNVPIKTIETAIQIFAHRWIQTVKSGMQTPGYAPAASPATLYPNKTQNSANTSQLHRPQSPQTKRIVDNPKMGYV